MDNILLSSKPIEISDYKTYKEATFLISVLDEWDENNRLIPKDVGETYHKTIIGFPIVAKLIRDIDGNPIDFRGHEMKIIQNEDGTSDCKFDTMPIGSVLDSWIENREVDGYDGKKDCIMIKAKLWSDRFPEYFTVLDKLWSKNNVKSSWELVVEKSEKTIRGKIIKAFSFIGNCILGSNTIGAVNGAGVYEYAQINSNDESNNELVLASALSKDCEDFSDNKNSEQEENNLKKSTQEVAEEEIIETPTETSEETVEETTPVDNATDEVKEENSNCNKEKEKEKSEEDVDDDKDDEKEPEKETSALTSNQLHEKLSKAVREKIKYAWVSMVFPIEKYCLVNTDECDELSYVKFTFDVIDDEVTLGEPENVKLVVSIAQINSEISAKNDAILKANEEIQTLRAENETLLSYKERCEKEDAESAEKELSEKQDKLRQYVLKSNQISEEELETEDFKKMISELDEVKIKNIISDRLVASLANKETEVETSEIKISEQAKANIDIVEDVIDYRSVMNSFLGK